MKVGADRKYTAEFREAAVKQVVEGGRSMPRVARSLEMSAKTLANWVFRARRTLECVTANSGMQDALHAGQITDRRTTASRPA
jgi:transposase-like protein